MSGLRYYVLPVGDGRWGVVHDVPGIKGLASVDADFPTQRAAEHEAAWLNAEHARGQAPVEAGAAFPETAPLPLHP